MARIGLPGDSTHAYAAYGITFAVPFRCPGLSPAPPDIPADVVVRQAPVPRTLEAPLISDRRWDAEPGRFLLRGGRRSGRFLVQGGAVTLERNPAAEEEVLARCFIEEVLPALLRQRGLVVLHANAVVTPRGVVAIAGPSGAGKSTTLAALLDRGCAMLADDLTALSCTPDGFIEVLPGAARVRLTEAAVNGLGYQRHPGLLASGPRMKSALAADASVMAARPGRLSAIYLLCTHRGRRVKMRSVTGLEKFDAVQGSIYGPMLPAEHPGAFPLIGTVMRTVDVYRLQRPAEGWTVPEVADVVLGVRDTAAQRGAP
jgi:hypothetical protein